jgi:hypothetical protein
VFEGANYLGESPKKWAGDMKERDMLAELRTRKDSEEGAYA